MAARDEVAIRLKATNDATRELDAASNSLMQLGKSAEGASFLARSASQVWMGAMMQIGNAITNYVTQGVALVSDAIIGFNARSEQALIGFTTMLGSASKAQSFMEELQDFAAATPFEFDGLRQSANLIMAMGFEAKEVIPLLTAAGDAVAALGLGTAEVQRVVYALGQMKSAGRVTGQDMMQLASMGIPAWKMLADSVGMTVAETKKAAEQGKIDAETAIKGITTAIEEGNMGGMMAAQARTFNGAISTIKDTIQIVVASAFKPLFDELSGLTLAAADFLGSADFLKWAEGVGEGIGEIIGLVMDLGESLIPLAMEILPAIYDAFASVADVFMRGLNVVVPLVQGLFGGLSSIGPVLAVILGPITQFVVMLKAAQMAAAAYAAVQVFLNSQMVMTAWTGFTNILVALPGLFIGGAAGASTFGAALSLATGGLSLIIPVIAAAIAILLQFVDVGKVLDNFAMDFGDMGDTVHAVAESTGRDYDDIKGDITELRDEFEFSFEEAAYILETFGASAVAMGDDVRLVMDGLAVDVEDAVGIIESMGDGWRSESADIIAAVEATGVSWEQAYDHLYTMNGGMIESDEILRQLNEAAAEGPAAWSELVAGVEPASEEFIRLGEEFVKTQDAIAAARPDIVENVRQTAEGIVVTLADGTEIIGTTADDVMGQIGEAVQNAKDVATEAVSTMLDEITGLFDSEEDAVTAAQEFAASIQNPFKDVDQVEALVRNLTMTEIPQAFSDGSTESGLRAANFVEEMLTKFDVLHPGLLERGEDAGTGLFEGMEPTADEIITWAEETFAPQLLAGMTLEEAMRTAGYDNMADYLAGIEAQEQAAYNAAYAAGQSGLSGVKASDYYPAGKTNASEYSGGLNNPATRTAAENAGGAVGRAGRDGLNAATAAAAQWGETVALAWANGLGGPTATQAAAASAGILAAAGAHSLAGSSPPKGGPLMHIDRGGYNVGVAWADGIKSSVEYARLAGKSLAEAMDEALATKFAVRQAEKEIAAAIAKKPAFTKAQLAAAGGNVAGAEASAYDTLMLMEMDARRAASTRPTLLTGGLGGESTNAVSITNQFGAGSVRSDEDIYVISRKIAEQVRMETV